MPLVTVLVTAGCAAPTLPLDEARSISEKGSEPADDALHFAPPGGKVKRLLVARGDLDGVPPEDVVIAADYVDAAGLDVASRLLVRTAAGHVTEPWEVLVEPALESGDEQLGFVRVAVVSVEGGQVIQVEHRRVHEGSDPREHVEGYSLVSLRDGRLQGILDCPRSQAVTMGPARATQTIVREIVWDSAHRGALTVKRTSSYDCGVCEEDVPPPPSEPPAEGAYRVSVTGAKALADDVCVR